MSTGGEVVVTGSVFGGWGGIPLSYVIGGLGGYLIGPSWDSSGDEPVDTPPPSDEDEVVTVAQRTYDAVIYIKDIYLGVIDNSPPIVRDAADIFFRRIDAFSDGLEAADAIWDTTTAADFEEAVAEAFKAILDIGGPPALAAIFATLSAPAGPHAAALGAFSAFTITYLADQVGTTDWLADQMADLFLQAISAGANAVQVIGEWALEVGGPAIDAYEQLLSDIEAGLADELDGFINEGGADAVTGVPQTMFDDDFSWWNLLFGQHAVEEAPYDF